jgi:hypothetical protein
MFIAYSFRANELYTLPKEIIIARDKVIASKQKMDNNIKKSYFNLCNINTHNDAQHIEFLAYREITGIDCWQLMLNN